MTPEERFERIEKNLQEIGEQQRAMTEQQKAQRADIDKMLDAAGKLIVVGRTCLDSIQELRRTQEATIQEMRELSKATDEKLNILIDTVDRIIGHRNGKQ